MRKSVQLVMGIAHNAGHYEIEKVSLAHFQMFRRLDLRFRNHFPAYALHL